VLKERIIKNIRPDCKNLSFVSGDILEEKTWEKIKEQIDFDKPVLIFSEGVVSQYFNKEQKNLLSSLVQEFLKLEGSIFVLDDTLRNHPEAHDVQVIKEGMAAVVDKSKSDVYGDTSNYQTFGEELSFWQDLFEDLKIYTINYVLSRPDMDFVIKDFKLTLIANDPKGLYSKAVETLSKENKEVRVWEQDEINYIACIFLKEGIENKQPTQMEDVYYHTIDSGIEYVDSFLKQGINSFLVFASTDIKSIEHACSEGIVKEFIIQSKRKFEQKINLFVDVGLSPYTSSGHSVVMKDNTIDEDESYKQASKLALVYAESGADYVCPCLSLHNQVEYLRNRLDESGFRNTKIMDYSAKFSSSLYGPYRTLVQSPLEGKDKKSYQTDYFNASEALNQVVVAEKQGANIVMVKPAMFYLDIVYQVRQKTKLPLAVYHISGEYTLIKLACKSEMLDEEDVFDEIHSAFERAGADYVIGYAPDHFF
jgi:porphobilinogen synthase